MRCTPTADELARLTALSNEHATAPGLARRARVILLSAEGMSGIAIAARLGLSNGQVSRILGRFRAGGIDGLCERPRRGRRDHAVPDDVVQRVLELASSTPPAGRPRWTTRLIAARVGLTSATISKILRTRTQKAFARPADVRNVSPAPGRAGSL
jgi:transposase